ncbi:hypothetical protein QU41_17620 [Bradyrhizobium elkanii]|nr:hypothetical protein QU41_17620 [Bradyrhizobium elkanii]
MLKRDDRIIALMFFLRMISAQTLRACRAGKPLHTFPDHAQSFAARKSVCRIAGIRAQIGCI